MSTGIDTKVYFNIRTGKFTLITDECEIALSADIQEQREMILWIYTGLIGETQCPAEQQRLKIAMATVEGFGQRKH